MRRFDVRRILRHDFADRLAVVHLQTLVAGNVQLTRIESKLVQDRRMEVRDIVTAFDGVVAEFVGGPMDNSALDTAAGHPAGEGGRMVIASLRLTLHAWGPAELRAPDHQCLVQQTPLFQVLEETADGILHLSAGETMVVLQVEVCVPSDGIGGVSVDDLDESNPPLHQPRAVRKISPNGLATSFSSP